ncbi:MAG: cysteine--tRNA ligase [Firmicutes bacterium]|nr:cysteine--tRNA ligase [Bacillota bacterium]
MLRLYNTLTRQKEEFKPRDPGKVGIYVCGVTPYAYTHLGHARVSVLWDVFKRYLEYKGFEVTLVQNFTDVDDKIIAKANSEGVEAKEIAERYIADYFETMAALGVRPADKYPRVTQEIPDIIEVIQGLIDKGHAYAAGGDVYFDVSSFPGYGKLSGRTLEEMEAGARVEVSPLKRDPLDFALWKAAKPGEPAWDSPWGKGRPGWHIECSVMSLKYLGESFDIHGGGLDLVFPHHENEIAQSEAYTGATFARFWVHNGMVQVDKEKMSKSIGNTTAVREVIKKWDPFLIRFFLISTHYRSPVNFSPEELAAAGKGWERLVAAAKRLEQVAGLKPEASSAGSGEIQELRELLDRSRKRFEEAMDDDFNTALAISVLYELVRGINPYLNRALQGEREYRSQEWLALYAEYRSQLSIFGDILGIFPEDLASRVDSELVSGLVELLLDIRAQARKDKNWSLADSIRDRLGQLGIEVKDGPQGSTWELNK